MELVGGHVRIVFRQFLKALVPIRHGVDDTVRLGGRGQVLLVAAGGEIESIAYDPVAALLCADVLGDSEWRFVSPRQRAGKDHLAGYDPARAPKVVDPVHIENAAYDYYDKYWKDYWQRLEEKHATKAGVRRK